MSLTDERILEILDTVEPGCVRLPLGWKLFAKAIEAEVTKTEVTMESLAFPYATLKVTKPQEPVAWVEVVDRHEGPYNFHGKELLDSGKHNLYTTPQPCQSCAEKQSAIDVWEGRYADLSAKCAELEDFCISQGNELAKLDEKVFDQDRLLKQQAEKISATLVALAGLPDGALDGGWTYAGMNKYALGLEVKCAELKSEVLSKEGMALVTKEDAENYCRILSLLGMEEEGSPVDGVEYLISLRDGMTCGDCNDTGWLENREEGRYPCTCMTEAEPYQILQAKCAELEQQNALYQDEVEQLGTDFNAQEIRTHAIRQERDALAIVIQKLRDALESLTHVEYALDLPLLQLRAIEALTLPDTSEIIKRHDAAIREEMIDLFRLKHRDYANEIAAELDGKS